MDQEFPDAVMRSHCLVIKREELCLVARWYLCDMSVRFARVPRLFFDAECQHAFARGPRLILG